MTQERVFAEILSGVAREVTLRQASDVCCGDLTLEQFQTLRAIASSESPSIGSLSTLLRVDLSTMSRNVTVLERNAYLARVRNAEDGRIVHAKLTAKGRRALETLRCGERDVLKGVYRRLPASSRAKIIGALESLQTCLRASGPTAAACCRPSGVTRKKAS